MGMYINFYINKTFIIKINKITCCSLWQKEEESTEVPYFPS